MPGSCLDDKTRNIIFPSRHINFMLSLLDADSKSLDEFMQTPLLDLKEINERLDTIGLLVMNDCLREKLTKAANALCMDYEKLLSEILKSYGSRKNHFSTFDQTRDLRNFLLTVAEITKDLPPSIENIPNSTKTLDSLVEGYNAIMTDPKENSIKGFFDYVTLLAYQINKIEAQKSERGNGTENKITYEELTPLIDFQKFRSFQHAFQVGVWHKNLYNYTGIAKIAVEGNYTKPSVVPREENCLVIRNGKWGVLHDRVIPNDTDLGFDVVGEVLEGVNSGGKTFDMKKALYLAALAQAGCWVPADYVKTSIKDRIIFREKGTGSSISALQQDCANVKAVNPNQGEYWLIGLDETFTSTERKGGEALTYGLIKYLTESGRVLLIVSSHYINLSQAFSNDRSVVFNNFPFTTSTDKKGRLRVEFPHKKNPGPMKDYKYGIAVATALDFDSLVLQYANERLKKRVIN